MKHRAPRGNDESVFGQMKYIYKCHNGLALVSKLKELSGDETFEFLPDSEQEEYLFINKNEEYIVVDNNGNLKGKSIHVPLSFLVSCKLRLTRTSEMFNQFGYN